MACIVKDRNALKRVQYVDAAGDRKTIRLGAMTMKQAEAIRLRIEQLVTATITKTMDSEAAEWAASLDDRMYGKLSGKGLVPPRQHTKATLGALVKAYLDTVSVKRQTKIVYEQATGNLEEYFGKDRALDSISCRDGAEWRGWLKKKGLAEATISKRVKIARTLFRTGIRWKMIRENPMDGVKAGVQTNRSRMYFLTRADAQKVLEACPDAEWRTIFALSRFGGLRCPSEHLALRWADIDWHHGRILIRSQKTEGYENGHQRVLPLFEEIRVPLLDLFEQAPEGTEFVINRYRHATVNMRTTFGKIIAKAGLLAWPRLFHSLRGSRATELCEEFPQHVVCSWLGHSAAVATAHYLSTTDAHFEKAVGRGRDVAPGRADESGGGVAGPGAPGRDAGKPRGDGGHEEQNQSAPAEASAMAPRDSNQTAP